MGRFRAARRGLVFVGALALTIPSAGAAELPPLFGQSFSILKKTPGQDDSVIRVSRAPGKWILSCEVPNLPKIAVELDASKHSKAIQSHLAGAAKGKPCAHGERSPYIVKNERELRGYCEGTADHAAISDLFFGFREICESRQKMTLDQLAELERIKNGENQ